MRILFGKEVLDTPSEIVDPDHTAVLVVDMQNDFCARGGHWDKEGTDMKPYDELVSNLRRFLEEAREAGVPIVFAQNTILPGMVSESAAWLRYKTRGHVPSGTGLEYCIDGTWGHMIMDEMGRREGEIVVQKYRPSAFLGTSLDQILRCMGIKSLIVTGVVSDGCVQGTAMEGLWRDYYIVVLKDCIAAPTRDRHDRAVAFLSKRVDVHEASEVINEWAKAKLNAVS